MVGGGKTVNRMANMISPLNDEWDNDGVSIQSSRSSDACEEDVPGHFHLQPQNDDQVTFSSTGSVGTSWIASVFLIVNACLGAGLLNFPQAYDLAGGIAVAAIIQGVLMLFIFGALLILAHCSDVNNSNTYQDVVLSMCGKRAHQLCALTIALYCYGTCLTFLVIIGDQFDRTFDSVYGRDFCHYWYMNRSFTIIASSLVLILPLCFPKRIDFLKYASSMGVVAILYIVIIITYEYFIIDNSKVVIRSKPQVWTDVFYVVPVICFGYQCHVSVIPIYSCLKDRNMKNFIKSSTVAILICIATYTVSAIFGYLTFGTEVNSDILQSYDKITSVIMIGIVAVAGKIYTTYPLLLFCGRTAIDGLWIDIRKLDSVDIISGEKKRRIVTVLVWFISNLVIVVFIDNLSDIIQILGSLAAVFIFVFPGLCLLQVSWKTDPNSKFFKSKLKLFIGGLYIVIGSFIFGLVFIQSILLDISGKAGSKPLCS